MLKNIVYRLYTMLYLIGIGLGDEKDITLKGLEIARLSDFVYLENYTSIINVSIKKLEELYGKTVNAANRELVESNRLVELAKDKNVALLIIGDVFSATTHIDLMNRAREINVRVEVVHNASILTAIGITGLSLYKFGKVASIPFDNKNIDTPIRVLEENNGMHTLFLLDLRPDENRFMTINDAIAYLLRFNKKCFTAETLCVGCCALGAKKQKIIAGKASELLVQKFDSYPQSLIVPGKLHFVEEDFLKLYGNHY